METIGLDGLCETPKIIVKLSISYEILQSSQDNLSQLGIQDLNIACNAQKSLILVQWDGTYDLFASSSEPRLKILKQPLPNVSTKRLKTMFATLISTLKRLNLNPQG